MRLPVSSSYRWKIALLCYLCVITFAFVFQSLPPIIGEIKAAFRLSYTQVGILMSLFALPGIFFTIPAGRISDKYGMKFTGITSLIITIIGTLIVALDRSYFMLGLGRAISGLGALSLIIVAAQLLTHWFIGENLGMVMGIYNTAMPAGTIIAFNTFGVIGHRYGWQLPIWLTVALSALTLIIYTFVYREPPDLPDKLKKNKYDNSGATPSLIKVIRVSGWPIWLVGLSWLLYNAAAIAFLTFGPDYFNHLGFSIASANLIASFFMWGALLISPIIGYSINRYFTKEFLIIFGSIAMALILLFTPIAGGAVVPLMVLLGLAAALVPAPIFALPADVMEPGNIGLGFGIITSCLNIGIVAGPYLVGLLRDQTGSFGWGFVLMAIFSLLGALPIIGLKHYYRSSDLLK